MAWPGSTAAVSAALVEPLANSANAAVFTSAQPLSLRCCRAVDRNNTVTLKQVAGINS